MSFEQPNYTQAPNAFFDDLLPEIDTVTELKVTLAVMRNTMGFHRKEHEMSLSYLEKATGLSRPAVVDGLKRAMNRGTVARRKVGQSYKYRLNVVSDSNQSEKPTSKQRLPEVVNDVNQQLVNKSNPRKKEGKKEKESTPVGTETSSVSANEFVSFLAEELDGADVPYTNGWRGRHGKQFKEHIRKGVPESALYKACDRIVERWTGETHAKLSVEQALGDVLNGKPPQHTKRHLTPTPSQFRGGNEHASVDEERKQRIRRQMGMAS